MAGAALQLEHITKTIGGLTILDDVASRAGGPVMEVVGYAISLLAMLSGVLDWFSALAWFLVAAAVHMLNSVGAIILSDTSLRRYRRSRDVLNLVVTAVFEQVGYRQFTLAARLWAGVQLLVGGLKGRW